MTAVGAILLTASGLLAGILGVKNLHDRVERACQLTRLLELMGFELERFKTPLIELFSSLSLRTEGVSSELCGRANAAMRAQDVIFREAWCFSCEILSGQEREILLPLGEILGRYGAEEQTAAIEAALADMRRYERQLRDDIRGKSRLWLGLSTSCGLLGAVLLW